MMLMLRQSTSICQTFRMQVLIRLTVQIPMTLICAHRRCPSCSSKIIVPAASLRTLQRSQQCLEVLANPLPAPALVLQPHQARPAHAKVLSQNLNFPSLANGDAELEVEGISSLDNKQFPISYHGSSSIFPAGVPRLLRQRRRKLTSVGLGPPWQR